MVWEPFAAKVLVTKGLMVYAECKGQTLVGDVTAPIQNLANHYECFLSFVYSNISWYYVSDS